MQGLNQLETTKVHLSEIFAKNRSKYKPGSIAPANNLTLKRPGKV